MKLFSLSMMLLHSLMVIGQAPDQPNAAIDSDTLSTYLYIQSDDSLLLNKGLQRIRNIGETNSGLVRVVLNLMVTHKKEYVKNDLEARYAMSVGWLYHQMGILDSAEIALDKALEIAELQGDRKTLSQIYSFLAILHMTNANYERSLDFYYKNLKTIDTLAERLQYANWHNSIGHLYRKMAEYDKAQSHLLKGIAMFDTFEKTPSNQVTRLSLVNELANVYYELKEYDRVFQMDEEIVRLSRESNNTRQLAFALSNLGEGYYQRNQFEKALSLYRESIQLKKSIGKHYVFSTYINVANLYTTWKPNHPHALIYLDSARVIAMKGTLNQKSQLYFYQYQLEKAKSNYQKALEAYQVFISYQDSITNEVKTKNMAELEKKYQIEQKQAENQQLQQINRQQTRTNFYLGLGAIVLAIFLLILIFLYQRLNKGKKIIEQQSRELHKLNDQKTEFFTNISHELRTPLTLLKGNLETLKRNSNMDLNEDKISKAKRNVRQLGLMIDDLLDLSKLELGQYKLKLVPTQINILLTRVLASFQSLSEEKGISIAFDSQIGEEIMVNLDPRQFEKAMSNILYNSFKFSTGGTTITLRSSIRDSKVFIAIQDQGPGITQVDIPYIFDRFYRSRSQQKVEGSGLGLAIVKEIIEHHSGHISVYSKAGSGATFEIELPVADVLDLGSEEEREILDIRKYIREKMLKWEVDRPLVMIVEDNKEMQEYLEEILSEDFRILICNNGIEAMSQIRTKTPSLIVSDVMMPEMDGFELLKNLKEGIDHRNIPIIMVTARGGDDIRLAALRLGVDDYIVKPFDPEELLIRVCTIIDNLQSRLKTSHADMGVKVSDATEPTKASSDDEDLLNKLKDYVLNRIADDQLQVNDLANHAAISLRQLYRRLAKLTGLTPNEFIMEVKLQHARKLLLAGKVTKVANLSTELGIATPAYFTRQFYKRFGKKPTDFI